MPALQTVYNQRWLAKEGNRAKQRAAHKAWRDRNPDRKRYPSKKGEKVPEGYEALHVAADKVVTANNEIGLVKALRELRRVLLSCHNCGVDRGRQHRCTIEYIPLSDSSG